MADIVIELIGVFMLLCVNISEHNIEVKEDKFDIIIQFKGRLNYV